MTTTLELFIPGPTRVRPEILSEMTAGMISHRGDDMRALLAACLPGVRDALGTRGEVAVLSSSSTGAMEAVTRGAVRPGCRALHLVNGNFSDLWRRLSVACGHEVAVAETPWGDAWDEASAAAALSQHGPVDAVFVAHSETSTGALSDIAGVARAARAAGGDETLVCVDVTSSACGVEVDVDARDLDVAVGGVQKAWALPPAIALAALSPRARARMEANHGRGYTNDLVCAIDFQNERALTATTPAIPQMRCLARQIRDIEAAGGMAARFERHREMQRLVLEWAARRGLGVLARAGFQSPTVTAIATEGRFSTADLCAGYREHGYFVAPGYGKTKETHWRLGHMGDHTPESVRAVLDATDAILEELGVAA